MHLGERLYLGREETHWDFNGRLYTGGHSRTILYTPHTSHDCPLEATQYLIKTVQ